MPRANRRRRDEAPLDLDRARAGVDRVERAPDGDWSVRTVPAAAATKDYRCPGCDQEIRAGTPHLVAWPVERLLDGPAVRRHWHSACWRARGRRAPR